MKKHGRNGTEYLRGGFPEYFISSHRYIKLLCLPVGILEKSTSNQHKLVNGIPCRVRHTDWRSVTSLVPCTTNIFSDRLCGLYDTTIRCCQSMRGNVWSLYCYHKAIGISLSGTKDAQKSSATFMADSSRIHLTSVVLGHEPWPQNTQSVHGVPAVLWHCCSLHFHRFCLCKNVQASAPEFKDEKEYWIFFKST